MADDYTRVAPVLQNAPHFCWAACMEWWLKYMGASRPLVNQPDFLTIDYIYEKTIRDEARSDVGGLTQDGVQRLIEYPPFKMTFVSFSIGELKMSDIQRALKKSPVVIAYKNFNGVGKHFNVIVDTCTIFDWCPTTLVAMEPATASFDRRYLQHYTRENVYLGYAS